MINQLTSQVATNAPKTDLKSDSKTESKEKLSEKSNAKEALSQALKQNLGLSKENIRAQTPLENFTQTSVGEKLKELVNKLLNQINAHKNPESPVLKQANNLNFAPNFANELKTLSAELAKSDIFSEVLTRLEQILKPVSELKAQNFAPLLKNSGVFFEAKLKDALNEELLPKSFHKLLNTIKSLSGENISRQIAQLANLNLSPEQTLKELKNIIDNNRTFNREFLKNSDFKALLNLSSKLENFKNYINKNPNIAQNKILKIAEKITKELNFLKDNFFKALSKPENLTLKDPKILKQVAQSFEKLENTLKHILDPKQNLTQTLEKKDLKNELIKNLSEFLSKNLEKNSDLKNLKEAENLEFEKKPDANLKEAEIKDANLNKDAKFEEKENLKNEGRENLKTPEKDAKNADLKNLKEAENLEFEKKPDANLKEAESKETNLNKDANLNKEANLNAKFEEKESLKTPEKDAKNADLKDLKEAENLEFEKKSDANLSKTQENKNAQGKENLKNELKENLKNEGRENLKTTENKTNENLSKTSEKNAEFTKPFENTQVQQNSNSFKEFVKQSVKNLAFSTENGNLDELENLSKDLADLSRKINEALKQLDPKSQNAKVNLNELKNLENKLNSSVKDLQNIKFKTEQDIASEIRHDVKSTLLQISNLAKNEGNEAVYNQANRLLAQIEVNQLMSLANDSINTYLPFFWDDLNDSKVMFRRGKKDKFFAQIKLEFVKLGTLEILVSLNNEKYIDINIMAESQNFRRTIYENAHQLKRNINKAGLLSANFFVGDIIRSKFDFRHIKNYDLEMGMDKKV